MTIEEYAAYYFDYNRLSHERRVTILKTLNDFESFTGKPMIEITPEAFREWMGHLLAKGTHVNGVRKLSSVVRTYVKVGWERGVISDGVAMRVRATKNPRGATGVTKPRPYSGEEIDRLYEDINARWRRDDLPEVVLARWREQGGKLRYGRVYPWMMNIQVRAVVVLALECGMRRSEIRGATIHDISPENEYVVVRMGKGEIDGEPKYREVPWTPHAHASVASWLEARSWLSPTHDSPWLVLTPGANENNPLLPSKPNNAMSKRAFGLLLTHLGSGWELHRLRHTCATLRLRAGMPIEALSEFLGHASIQQTLCYAELNREDIKRHAERTNARFANLIGEHP